MALIRRVNRGPAAAPERTTVREIESWLLTEALGEEDLLELFESLAWRLVAIGGWRPLRTGIALHEGDVFFGNVGAPERLDFTVIGREVNAASRVEALSKSLGRPILITAPVAERLACPLEPPGTHRLKGLANAVTLFAPRQEPSS